MRLSDIYKKNKKVNEKISFEVFPPKNGNEGIENLLAELNSLKNFNPALISLTYGAGGNNNNSMHLVSILHKQYNLMPHLTCVCNGKIDIETHIKLFEQSGIENILALRGDIPQDETLCKKDFRYANELIEFIKYRTNLSVGAAGYPEGHIEAESLSKDIENLKRKVDTGAEAIYTQLFFDNNKFFEYIELVRNAGITLPVIAGIMPVISTNQVEKMTSMAKISITPELKSNMERYKNSAEDMKSFGIEYASKQCCELINNDVDGLHFYTLNKAYSTGKILENIL